MNTSREDTPYRLERDDLQGLIDLLLGTGYTVIGPSLAQDAITLAPFSSLDELPRGVRDHQAAGSYRLSRDGQVHFFGYAVGPHSIKNILHPPQRPLLQVEKSGDATMHFSSPPLPREKYALFGIRSCDIEAIRVLDKVFSYPPPEDNDAGFYFSEAKAHAVPGQSLGHCDPHYRALRDSILVITATCSEPSRLCFCTSMGHGPRPSRFDLNITEIYDRSEHYFIVESGSRRGSRLLAALAPKFARSTEVARAEQVYHAACRKISKTLANKNLPELLATTLDHPRWDEVATRCLSCGNCTMVCPTCFCTTVLDRNDLDGEHSERWLYWDSCFTRDFSYIHGGSVRPRTRSRYRQWLTHKLGTWHEQFGTSGCVGCGRCIAWCPVEIDLTEEIAALREHPPRDD